MTLQEKLKKDLQAAMKNRDENQKAAIRVVMGEMARLDKKQFADDEIIRILKKLIKSEKELLERSGQASTSPFIEIIDGYLPKMATREDIHRWIAENVDFAAYNNKMQAMGAIMAHFGAAADGAMVKQVLQAFEAPV